MAAANYDFIIEQGSTFRKQLTYTDSAGVVVDLTGYSARMQLRTKITDANIIISLTDLNSGITFDAPNGIINLFISDTNTAAFTFKTAVYDLEIIAPGGDVTRLLSGTITLSKEVTR